MKKAKLGHPFSWAAFMIMLCANTHALQPVRFNHQARLTDMSGAALAGDHTVYFSLHQGGDAATANSGANVYAETATVAISNGTLNHAIGSGAVTSGSLTADLFDFDGEIFVQVAVDTQGNVLLPRQRLEPVPFAIGGAEPAGLFGRFGGSGKDGVQTTLGNQVFAAARYEFENLTIPDGTTFTATQPFTFIAVKGTCVIGGGLTADSSGARGGNGRSGTGPGQAGYDATTGRISSNIVIPCLCGRGGGGGAASTSAASSGGGAGSVGSAGVGLPTEPFQFVSAGVAGSGTGTLKSDNIIQFLSNTGAGGGGGAGNGSGTIGGAGGDGGGVIYVECGELVFTGTISAAGQKGLNGLRFLSGSAGGGGGGGGGIILVRARKITVKTGTVKVTGGNGGTGVGGGSAGVNGADGFWDIVELP
jgi:hypothetical protein